MARKWKQGDLPLEAPKPPEPEVTNYREQFLNQMDYSLEQHEVVRGRHQSPVHS